MNEHVQTETIDKLFLELSQLTKATTKREIEFAVEIMQLRNERDRLAKFIDEYKCKADNAAAAERERIAKCLEDGLAPEDDNFVNVRNLARSLRANKLRTDE